MFFGKILLPAAIATSIATRVATGIAARVAARVAGPVAQAYVVVVAQRGGREERQREKFIIHPMIPLFFYARKKLKGQIITGFFPALACICFVVDDLVQNSPQQGVFGLV